MKNAARSQQVARNAPDGGREPSSAILTLEQARRVYLQSSNRLDLATLARAFEGAPECIDVAGKMPPPRKLK